MNVLIIDFFHHLPFLKLIFPEADYHAGDVIDSHLKFINIYNFGKDISTIDKSKKYDLLFVSFPTEDVYLFDKYKLTNLQWQTKYQNILKELYDLINQITYKQLYIFDSGDYPFIDLKWYEDNGYYFDKLFKVNYRTIALNSYNEKVKSFPYMLFGYPCPMWYFLTTYNQNAPINPECYWGHGALGDSPPHLPECFFYQRKTLFDQIKHKLIYSNNPQSFENYIKGFQSNKYFVIMNGSGKIHRRHYEGMAWNSLPFIEKNDVIYPKKLYAPNPFLMFSTAEEFIIKLEQINSNNKLYKNLLNEQIDSIHTSLNINTLRQYILE
jgi:hypothetical protein